MASLFLERTLGHLCAGLATSLASTTGAVKPSGELDTARAKVKRVITMVPAKGEHKLPD